ncbi:universal stress protein [Mycobacterium intracellulare]|uniref:Universal stress protein n=1 Tax=Mycobacterium intracellulare subsp. chimaera TaxID=222805 RepID=A0A7U5MKD0_MYCIT|nr:universal stress protein [Mycobacterium intracellulare]ASL15151.1 Universal stress protein family protein [Mycobacterium intracellulare subsp. chimaera]ASQ89193.1 universal stress protein [Mycobacterium intracellulare subsp. chimaera]MCF1811677.1 universal stress protein [Mycobacterium intracellulare subsp. intracellulare]MDM3926269.1 universal stress protein [Mycobacterium intracellulare subsp. chimaera]MDS0333212.1 universal stress protein [Mycobacterium intracellulare]
MKAVIAGIDGSQAAITAALWGVDEAMSRALPLRLISVIKQTHLSPDDYARDLTHAERSLSQAQNTIAASRKSLTVETEIPRGPAGAALIEASRDAAMICVGSVGIGRYARSLLGSTATEVAEKASCPVAVVRTESEQPPPAINWVIVRMTDAPDNEEVVKHAVWEANLRRAPLLILGGRPEELTEEADGAFERRVREWRQRHPEVRAYPITTKFAIASYLETNDERVQLAVISASEADQLARLIGPAGHPLFRHPECSVLVARS